MKKTDYETYNKYSFRTDYPSASNGLVLITVDDVHMGYWCR